MKSAANFGLAVSILGIIACILIDSVYWGVFIAMFIMFFILKLDEMGK